jgi:hypothetical protein
MFGQSIQLVTELLMRWNAGDQAALDELVPLIYKDLRAIAGRELRRERPGHTLQSAVLVHEAYLRLLADDRRDRRGPGRVGFDCEARVERGKAMVDA